MKKIILSAVAAVAMMPAMAQETYENAGVATQDLNGTARYVGMGGAMDALGADISTISSNPAGLGLMRRGSVSISGGLISQEGASEFDRQSPTQASFDQAGFVLTTRTGVDSWLNFGFNYHKSKNNDYILHAANTLTGASQNKLSYIKGMVGCSDRAYSQVDEMYYNTVLPRPDKKYYYVDGESYLMDRRTWGYTGSFDFNISGNIHDRVYLGVTLGVKDVRQQSYSEYTEKFVGSTNNLYDVGIADERKITGTGFDITVGAIWRPIEDSPFRIGATVATPTFYDLTTQNYTYILNESGYGTDTAKEEHETFDYCFNTPWKFGVSLGHVFANCLAVGAGWEYQDWTAMDNRIKDGVYYDYYGSSSSSHSDREMNADTRLNLKGVHTLKVGAEMMFTPQLAVRLGYNYVSPMYNKNGYKDGTVESLGSFYASQTDYTNWQATNRFTCGLGYKFGNWNFDMAYQYSQTNGEFAPFMSYRAQAGDEAGIDNIATATNVSNKRHQLLATLTYRF